MNYAKILRYLGTTIILILLVLLIPAKPALAAPVITLSPTSGATGTRVTISGVNFSSYIGDSLTILFNGMEIADSPKTVSAEGNFDAGFNVPAATTSGTAWVSVRGPLGTIIAHSLFSVSPTEIQLNISEGFVGTTVTVNATGFYASEVITFYYLYDGVREILGTEMAGITGKCTRSLVIPRSTASKHLILAENRKGNWADADFTVCPAVTLSSDSGAAGDIINVTGSGFGSAGEVTIYFRNTVVSYISTDEYGSFEGGFRVPVMKARTYDMRITDRYGNVARLEFTIAASASLGDTTGNVGMEITINGTGFIPGETISINYDTLQVTATTADGDGAFATTFDVPLSTAGNHVVTISDGASVKQLTFAMESEPPPVPLLLLPEAAIDVESPVHLQWQAVNDPSPPVVYSLQVASDEDFTTIVLEKEGLTDPEYTPTEEEKLKSTKRDAPYYWRVKAVDGASNESEWSAPRTFLIPSTTLPAWALSLLIVFSVLVVAFLVYRLRKETAYQ